MARRVRRAAAPRLSSSRAASEVLRSCTRVGSARCRTRCASYLPSTARFLVACGKPAAPPAPLRDSLAAHRPPARRSPSAHRRLLEPYRAGGPASRPPQLTASPLCTSRARVCRHGVAGKAALRPVNCRAGSASLAHAPRPSAARARTPDAWFPPVFPAPTTPSTRERSRHTRRSPDSARSRV